MNINVNPGWKQANCEDRYYLLVACSKVSTVRLILILDYS